MSDTIVQTVDQNALVDIFADLRGNTAPNDGAPKFGMAEVPADLFTVAPPISTTSQTTEAPKEGGTDPEDTQTTPPAGTKPEDKDKGEADILGTSAPAAPPASVISDLSTYYQDRIKSGKFVKIDDQDEKGNLVPFVPKTPEEYDEVLEIQINHRLDQAKKQLEQSWYNSKSPAWRAVSQYAEFVDDPTQLIPFLQGVKTLTSVANLDENELEGAEAIVRSRLTQKGDPEEIITQQIDALKTTDKLISTAKLYKPVIIQQEQAQLQRDMRERQEQERQYQALVSEIRDNALKSIESPVFGKTKLKQEEKAAIYDLIAEPAEETQGYGIYNAIDQLFEQKNFEKLKEIALLVTNRDAFMNYLGTSVANATAASLERKLRVAGESRSNSGNDFHEENNQPRVVRNQFKSKPTFGR